MAFRRLNAVHVIAVVILVLFITAVAAFAAPASAPVVAHFENGLTAIVQEDHSAPVAAVRFYVGVGSVYEGKYLGAGITHFLEHTIGEGTPTRSHDQIQAITAETGNDANAYTSEDHTCYFMTTPARDVEKAIDLIGDYTFNATFPEKEVETQRGIILREMAMRDEGPEGRLYERYMLEAFRVHPQRYRVIGYPDIFNRITRQDLVDYHKAFYVPENITAVVAGDFAASDVLAMLHKYLDKYPVGVSHRPVLPVEPAQVAPRRCVVDDKTASRAYCMMGFRSASLYSPDLYALDTLAYVLANGDVSRLVADVQERRGLVDSISGFSETPTFGDGTFAVSFVCDPANIHAAEKAVQEHLARLQTEPVTADELERAKRQKAAESIYGRETTEGLASALGSDYISTGDVDFSNTYVAGIRKVTAADIQRVARQYLRNERYTFACLRPPTATTGPATVAKSAAPVTTRKKLASGLTLLVTEDHRLPTVHLYCTGLGGVRFENERNNGIGRLMMDMLTRGTKTRTREQIAAALESDGGSISATSGLNSFGVTATALSANAASAIEVLADCLTNPAFSEVELQRAKELTIAAIKAQNDEVDKVADHLLLRSYYTTHPYRLDPLGTEATIKALTRADLVAFHQRLVRAGGLALSVVGDVQAAQVEALATKAFAGLPAGAVSPANPPQEPPLTTVKEVVVKRDQRQAITNFAFPGQPIGDADRYKLDVMQAAFAGIGYGAGRLYEAMRGNQLVYSAFGFPVRGLDSGYFGIYAGTDPAKADEARQRIIDLIKDIQGSGITEKELQRAKKIAIATHEIGLQSPAARARTQASDELYGLGYENYKRYAAEIEKVTTDDVLAMTRKYMDLEHYVIAITRPGEDGK